MITRSKRKALVFCEANSLKDDLVVCIRVEDMYFKRHTYNCTPYQALNHMLLNKFIWFDRIPHI